jgi:hypothetical protein
MIKALELVDLSVIEQGMSLYISPAGNAGEKLFQRLKSVRPDIEVAGFVDTYKNGERAGLKVNKLDELPADFDEPVVVAIERQDLRARIADGLTSKGLSRVWFLVDDKVLGVEQVTQKTSALYFFYDLSVNALNFEYLNSLCHAEVERIRQGLDYIHPVIVPRSKASIFDLSRTAVAGELESDNTWFMDNVIIPSASLVPSVKGISVFETRQEAQAVYGAINVNRFPDNYSMGAPAELNSSVFLYDNSQGKHGHDLPFKASATAKKFVQQWLACQGLKPEDKLVVITLREAAYQTERNSNLRIWKSFADRAFEQGYIPIFIRDTYAAFSDGSLAGYPVFGEAAWNIYLRIAIYELAYLNMMSCTGPHTLCTYNKRTRYIIFNTLADTGYIASQEFLENGGIPIDFQYFAKEPCQRAVWGKDQSWQLIMQEFQAMVECIKQYPEVKL